MKNLASLLLYLCFLFIGAELFVSCKNLPTTPQREISEGTTLTVGCYMEGNFSGPASCFCNNDNGTFTSITDRSLPVTFPDTTFITTGDKGRAIWAGSLLPAHKSVTVYVSIDTEEYYELYRADFNNLSDQSVTATAYHNLYDTD